MTRALFVAITGLTLVLFVTAIGPRATALRQGALRWRVNDQGKVIITQVVAGAAPDGIHPGDQLLSIGGTELPERLTPDEATRLILPALAVPAAVSVGVRAAGGPVRAYELAHTWSLPPTTANYLVALDAILFGLFLTGAGLLFVLADHWVGLLTSLALLLYAYSNTPEPAAAVLLHPVAKALQTSGWIATIWVFVLFPTGRFSPRWAPILAVLGTVFGIAYDWAHGGYSPQNWGVYGDLISMGLDVAIVSCVIYRLRHANREERQQTKWAAYGLLLGYLAYWAFWLPQFHLRALQEPSTWVVFQIVGRTLYDLVLLIMLFAICLSVLKYGLWHVDVVINRTLVYGLLTGALTLIGVTVRQLVEALHLAERFGSLSIILNTLVDMALLDHGRKFLQERIDTWFYRKRLELQKAVLHFTAAMHSYRDPGELLTNLVTQVAKLLESKHAAVYLRSTGDGFALAQAFPPPADIPRALALDPDVRAQLEWGRPVESPAHPWFPLLLPLLIPDDTRGTCAGILAVGPLLSGEAYTSDTLQLLVALANEVGLAVEVARLLQAERHQDDGLRSINDLGFAIAGESDPALVQEHVARKARSLSNADRSVLYLRQGDLLQPVALASATPAGADGALRAVGVALPPLHLRDPVTWEPNVGIPAVRALLRGEVVQSSATDLQPGSGLAVPLKTDDSRVIGVIELLDARDPATGRVVPFVPEVQRLIEALAAVAAIGLQVGERERTLRAENAALKAAIGQHG